MTRAQTILLARYLAIRVPVVLFGLLGAWAFMIMSGEWR
jgi:hypothetical protein